MVFDFTKEPGKLLLNRELNKDDKPLVSIITAYYNAGKYFEQTFNCVMNQTFPYFEWIIVDDGSNNLEDIELLEKFANKDKRIRLYHKENGGISSARNFGIKQSNTDIIIPLDADDLIVPTYVECNYWGLYYNSSATWSYTDCLGFQGQEYLWKKEFSPTVMKNENLLVCTAAIRKQELIDIGCYDDSHKHYNEDWYVWLKLMSKSKFPVHLAQYGFWYRRVNDGVLSIVLGNEEITKKSKHLISKAAETVDVNISAKEYPSRNLQNKFEKPKVSNWNRKVFNKNNKIKVMMLIPWMEMGGADLFNLDIVRRIDKNKFEISILTTIPGVDSWKQRFEEYVTDIFELPSFLDINNYAEFISYFIKSREINIIFLSHSYLGYYLLPWIRMNFPNVSIIDCLHADMQFWRNGGYARLSEVDDSVIEKTIVSNECTKDVMIDGYGKSTDKVKVIYTGVDQDYFNPDAVDCSNLRNEHNIDENRPIVLYLCRIAPEKRPFLMLEIAKEVKKRISDICFLVVGDGIQFDEFKQKIVECKLEDTVSCVGRKEDIRPYYKVCDISLICSIKEGLAITTFDAMQMGKPVVSADVGSQYELVNDATGKLIVCRQDESKDLDSRIFSKEEICDYADAIENILADKQKYAKMSDSCKMKIDKKFSMKITTDTIQKEFEELVNNNYFEERRIEISKKLNSFPSIINDYVTIFNEYEYKNLECEEVWNIKQWYHRLYEKTQYDLNGYKITIDSESVNIGASEAQKRLDEIYNMRTWKLIRKYQNFMDNSFIGRILRKIRDMILPRHERGKNV